MTDEQIIKALECCTKKYGCCDCPLENDELCMITINKEALSLIKRQQARIEQEVDLNREMFEKMARDEAEIERKGKILNSYALQYGTVTDQSKKIKEIKDEAYKEFAESVKEKMDINSSGYILITEMTLDNLLKEMTEVKDDEKD